ncbi:MAG: bifunctional nuclease family protein [Treponema sp.]|jgi:bifunctional DNase/RNase|nr:bifunctional nuclease family protein [Treponema sp.]
MKMIEAEIWTIVRTDQGNAALLRPLGSDISAPIFIGQSEAQAILMGLGEVAVLRPLTHDLLLDVIRRLGFDLFRAEVHDLRDGVFYARLFLSGGNYTAGDPLVLDARPSDAIALAVRCKCPVFVSEKVMEEAGVSIDLIIGEVSETGRFPGGLNAGASGPEFKAQSRRKILQAKLEVAVEAEEYERAAEFRDILTILDRENKKKNL